jgi:hypothetical protein
VSRHTRAPGLLPQLEHKGARAPGRARVPWAQGPGGAPGMGGSGLPHDTFQWWGRHRHTRAPGLLPPPYAAAPLTAAALHGLHERPSHVRPHPDTPRRGGAHMQAARSGPMCPCRHRAR